MFWAMKEQPLRNKYFLFVMWSTQVCSKTNLHAEHSEISSKHLECGTYLEVSVTETGGMWKRWARCIWWEVEKDGNADRNTQWNMKGGLWSDFFCECRRSRHCNEQNCNWQQTLSGKSFSVMSMCKPPPRLFISSSHITVAVNLPVSMCLRFYSLVMR